MRGNFLGLTVFYIRVLTENLGYTVVTHIRHCCYAWCSVACAVERRHCPHFRIEIEQIGRVTPVSQTVTMKADSQWLLGYRHNRNNHNRQREKLDKAGQITARLNMGLLTTSVKNV